MVAVAVAVAVAVVVAVGVAVAVAVGVGVGVVVAVVVGVGVVVVVAVVLRNAMNSPEVSLLLGITEKRLRALRGRLEAGVHYRQDPADRRGVVYTEDGLQRLRDLLLAEESTPPAENAPTPAQAPPQAIEEELVVFSRPRQWPSGQVSHFANPHVVQATRSTGERVYVRVTDSRHFVPVGRDGLPMTLRARYAGDPAHWSLVGRLPRWPGRW